MVLIIRKYFIIFVVLQVTVDVASTELLLHNALLQVGTCSCVNCFLLSCSDVNAPTHKPSSTNIKTIFFPRIKIYIPNMDYPTPESSDRTAPSLPSSVDEHPIITVSNRKAFRKETRASIYEPMRVQMLISESAEGKYRGGTDRFSYYKPIQQWLGIPYAYPPTGPLRFRPPKPLTSALIPDANLRIFDVWERWGAQCPASKLYKNQYAFENEDCLNLNIFRAANQLTNEGSKELLPVILYIHGGDFLTGNGRDSYNVGGLVASACLPVM